MYNLDIARCLGHHNNKRFLRDRVKEVPGITFSLNYPHSEFTTGRALRTSPIFPKLQLAGAQFGQVMGYEKPMYFKAKKPQSLDMGLMGIDAAEEAAASQGETLKLPIAKTETFYRPPWFQAAAEEFQVRKSFLGFYLLMSPSLRPPGRESVSVTTPASPRWTSGRPETKLSSSCS